MMGCTSNQDLIMISHHNIRGYHIHKTELQALLKDHSPDVVTLNETFTKKGYKYNMPHYTAVTRNREHGKRGGVTILLRHDLTYTEMTTFSWPVQRIMNNWRLRSDLTVTVNCTCPLFTVLMLTLQKNLLKGCVRTETRLSWRVILTVNTQS